MQNIESIAQEDIMSPMTPYEEFITQLTPEKDILLHIKILCNPHIQALQQYRFDLLILAFSKRI